MPSNHLILCLPLLLLLSVFPSTPCLTCYLHSQGKMTPATQSVSGKESILQSQLSCFTVSRNDTAALIPTLWHSEPPSLTPDFHRSSCCLFPMLSLRLETKSVAHFGSQVLSSFPSDFYSSSLGSPPDHWLLFWFDFGLLDLFPALIHCLVAQMVK